MRQPSPLILSPEMGQQRNHGVTHNVTRITFRSAGHFPATTEKKDGQKQRLTLKSTVLQTTQPSPGHRNLWPCYSRQLSHFLGTGTSGLAAPGSSIISWAQGPLASQIMIGLYWNIAAAAVAEDPLQPVRLRSFGVPDYHYTSTVCLRGWGNGSVRKVLHARHRT